MPGTPTICRSTSRDSRRSCWDPAAATCTFPPTSTSRFGVVVQDGDRVARLVEKPESFVSDQAIVGVNYVRDSATLLTCLERLVQEDRRTRGEFQLTDALQLMVEGGAHLGTFPVDQWCDCGTLEALLATKRHLLAGVPVPQHSADTAIIPPVHIDPSAQIRCSVLGPHVSVGEGARLDHVMAANTIIGSGAAVTNMQLVDTLVGYQAVVTGRPSRLNVGDMSEVDM